MTVVDVLTGEPFLQGLFLLIVTAVLTGLLVPVVKARLDDRRYREQKLFESELARQAKVIDAQATLLDGLSDLLWGFLLAALGVTYYAERGDAAKLTEAWARYDAEAWVFFARLRAETSKAQRLTSHDVYEELLRLNEWFMPFDAQLTNAVASGLEAGADAWTQLSRRTQGEGAALVDGVLTRLAQELRLTPSVVSQTRYY